MNSRVPFASVDLLINISRIKLTLTKKSTKNHPDIASFTHMKPSIKAIFEGHRGNVGVIAQAFEVEVLPYLS